MPDSKTCRYHPDAEAKVFCGKHEWGYCEECLASCMACTDPELYCRHRTACVIWELCRKTRGAMRCAAWKDVATATVWPCASAPVLDSDAVGFHDGGGIWVLGISLSRACLGLYFSMHDQSNQGFFI